MHAARIRGTLFIILSLCSAVAAKVTVDWDKQASFTGYKTYAWQKGTPAKNPLMDQRIVDAIDKQLSSLKGLQKVESEKDADFGCRLSRSCRYRNRTQHDEHGWMGYAVGRGNYYDNGG